MFNSFHALYIGICKWAQGDYSRDERTNSIAVSEAALLSVYRLHQVVFGRVEINFTAMI